MEFLTLFVTLILTFVLAAFSARQFLGLVLQMMDRSAVPVTSGEKANIVGGVSQS